MSERSDERRYPSRAFQVVVFLGLGAALVLVGILGVSVLLGGPAPGGPDIPASEFEYDYDADNRTVRVAHGGGDPFYGNGTERLYLTVNGSERATLGLPFRPGDGVTLAGVDPGSEVAVVWERPGGSPLTISRRTVGTGAGNGTATTTGGG